ncbi:beta-ketoacyl synthase N-terminal-like domain-containing protein [Streptosporangium sp. NPDC000396]|uniref:beta-ketoacyl synthase N-terminal-like domain-containing protein n=1 Tax=Streptosporangium sp. NPDC000396 TaxID=3366185 RepID=UPI0036ADE7E1
MNARTAVITGVGWAVAGLSGGADLLEPDTRSAPGFAPDTALVGRGLRHKDRASKLALKAAQLGLKDAGLLGADLADAAVIVSSNLGNLDTVCDFLDIIAEETVTGISPMRVPHMSSNVTACWVALEHGIRGPNITLCNGATSGLDAASWARNMIMAGRSDIVVVIGVEPDTPPVARFHREQGAWAWLDGAVALVVEASGHAGDRGATPLAEISGYGRAAETGEAVRLALGGERPEIVLGLGETGLDCPSLDLTGRLGRCSGALGVLQCAVGAERVVRTGGGAVLAVAGGADSEGDDPDMVAAVLLARAHETKGISR